MDFSVCSADSCSSDFCIDSIMDIVSIQEYSVALLVAWTSKVQHLQRAKKC